MSTGSTPPLNLPEIFATLQVDAMYFRAALDHLEEARKAEPDIRTTTDSFMRLKNELATTEADPNLDDYKKELKVERLCIQLVDADESVGAAYAPLLENIALVHILSAASLEAHINARAKEHLTPAMLDEFDKNTIVGKWLFLPRILGHAGFDPGAEPLQSVAMLAKLRNQLSHYKARREPWESSGPTIPRFLEKLGLRMVDGERSIKAVREIVSELSSQFGEHKPPSWLDYHFGYFELQFESERKKRRSP